MGCLNINVSGFSLLNSIPYNFLPDKLLVCSTSKFDLLGKYTRLYLTAVLKALT